MEKIIFGFLLIAAMASSCDKQTEVLNPFPPRTDETPLSSSLYNNETAYTFYTYDPQQREVGYAFQALKKGKIYAMGIRMPQAGQDFIVTFWDSATHTIIKQKRITNGTTTGFSYIDLSSNGYNEEFEIVKNHTYYITVNTSSLTPGTPERKFYNLTKAGSANFLPLIKNNIKILNGVYSSLPAPLPIFPDKTNFDVFGLHMLFGLVDIGFYATEY